MSSLTRDGIAEPVSRDQILRREPGQGEKHFSCSADHEQDWQPDPVDPYSCYCICVNVTIHGCSLSDTYTSAAGDDLTNIMENHTFVPHAQYLQLLRRRRRYEPQYHSVLRLCSKFRDSRSFLCLNIKKSIHGKSPCSSSEVPRNPLTRWDVSSTPANGIFLTKKLT